MYEMPTTRPPPILTDLPPTKRARGPPVPTVSPMHASMQSPYGACIDPHMILKAAQFRTPMMPPPYGSCKRVVTPQRGAALGVLPGAAAAPPLATSPCRGSAASPAAAKTGRWTKREDEKLRLTVEAAGAGGEGGRDWAKIALEAFNGGRSPPQCSERWDKVLKLGLVKGPWTPQEDDIVRAAVGSGVDANFNWSDVAKLLPGRLTKQVRERWQNHLDPQLVKTPWTPNEDYLLVSLQAVLGNRWNEISRAFQGRSENAIKNRWNSKQRRRFLSNSAASANDANAASRAGHPAPTPGPLCRPPPPHISLLHGLHEPPKVTAVNFKEALLAAFGSDHEQEAAMILRKLRTDEDRIDSPRHALTVA